MKMILVLILVIILRLSTFGSVTANKKVKGVKYDNRSLIINGNRELLFSGSIHYPRSPPEMWLDIINKAKEGGLNTIQAYYSRVKEGLLYILAQIENEYNNIELAYKESGNKYIDWAANMAVNAYNGVPWIMCKQKDCGDTWTGPNGPDKPSLWTENWTAQYRVFGDPPSQRAVEDIAFSVAHFFTKNGTHNNYYMYYGGTNFGRSTSSFVTTSYYDEAPLDEFGLRREPKFGHLRDLHRALRLAKRNLLRGTRLEQVIDRQKWVVTYEKDAKTCAAFFINIDTKDDTINFRGADYLVPLKSISILPDCKTVVYNTNTVVTQHNARNFHISSKVGDIRWEYYSENVPTKNHLPLKNRKPLELYVLAKDTSDYAWYSTRIHLDDRDLPMKARNRPVLQVASLGHAMLAFVNGEYVGFQHGTNVRKDFVMQKTINLKRGANDITFLAMTIGFPTYFDAPEGTSPVAIRMDKMSKGMIWVNGKSIGRYWVSFLSPLGQPSQSEYHVPRSFLKPKKNLLVVLEEIGGDPSRMKFLTVNRDTICSIVRENVLLPDVKSWERLGDQVRQRVQNLTLTARLTCPDQKVIKGINFASFGNSEGSCGVFKPGNCNAPNTLKVVQQLCRGKKECSVPVDRGTLIGKSVDYCPHIAKVFAVQARCGHPDKNNKTPFKSYLLLSAQLIFNHM